MDVHDLTAAYALDALDAEERETYEAHLARCEQCREELARLGETAGALAYGVESPAPPPALRERILTAAGAGHENVVPLPVRRPWVFRAAVGTAAVAACTAIGLGVWASSLSHSLDTQRSAAAAMRIVVDPASQKTALKGESGLVAVAANGQGVLVVRELPPAPAGKVYEAWVIPAGGAPERAGTFDGGRGTTVVPLERTVPSGAVVATTVEPDGGVDAPTGSPIATAQT